MVILGELSVRNNELKIYYYGDDVKCDKSLNYIDTIIIDLYSILKKTPQMGVYLLEHKFIGITSQALKILTLYHLTSRSSSCL